ncbi:cupin domain-containing protein [Pseudoalteromonas sp. SIMBA_153]
MQVISNAELKVITHVDSAGESIYVGEVQPFNSNELLKSFLQHKKNPNFTFVKLKKGETHRPHVHDCDSMLIVTNGSATLTGDLTQKVSNGSVVCIPAGKMHGFTCHSDTGFVGISIQFSQAGLFDDVDNPNINFSYTERLIEHNEQKCEAFKQSPFFKLIAQGVLKEEASKAIFYSNLRMWSDKFQEILYARQISAQNESFRNIFSEHLAEEFGHNKLISEKNKWDPVIEACSDWFTLKMLQLDNDEKLVMTHMVLELCGDVFHTEAAASYTQEQKLSDEYMTLHAHLDEGHSQMGIELLRINSKEDYERFIELSNQSWKMLELVLNRVAEITISELKI